MNQHTTPLVPQAHGGSRWLRWLAGWAIRLSPLIGPRPAARLIRLIFAAGGAEIKRSLDRHAPPPRGTTEVINERYGRESEAHLDVFHPAGSTGPLPLLLWVHGGGWVGGSKDNLAGYLKILAMEGFTVVGADYSLAPRHRYPTPLRQMMLVLQYLQDSAERYRIDPRRIIIGGDSAGAQIAAQLALLASSTRYQKMVEMPPTIGPQQLRGVVLACGVYDRLLAAQALSPAGKRFLRTVTWAYTGKRHFLLKKESKAWSVTDNLTRDFPPALITAGNADPLRPHSELLATRLDAVGVQVETVFFPPHHRPRVGHGYQFGLDTVEARKFLARQKEFLRRVSAVRP